MIERKMVNLSGRQGWGWMAVVVGMFLASVGRGAVEGTTVPGDVAKLKRKKGRILGDSLLLPRNRSPKLGPKNGPESGSSLGIPNATVTVTCD